MIDEQAVTDWRRTRRPHGLVEYAACRQLRELASGVPAGQHIVELGAYRGRSTGWLLLGAQDAEGAEGRPHVTTVDPWGLRKDDYSPRSPDYTSSDTYRVFRDHMDKVRATPQELTIKRAYGANAGRRWDSGPVGLLYHDAEHTAQAVEEDLAAWLPHLAPGAVIALHDAGDPRFEVEEGARRVLEGTPGWDWAGRELQLWAKRPHRRGLLIVRHHHQPQADPEQETVR